MRGPKQHNFLKKIFGNLYTDKGYLSKELAAQLFYQGLHLATGIRNSMKKVLMTMRDKILLRKRSVIETINDQLKISVKRDISYTEALGIFLPTW